MQKGRGISLIVLVITIIVMIILTGAIILSLNNSGIINQASGAVEQTNLATVKELAQMAWAEAYASGVREQEELQQTVYKALEENEIDESKYVIEVTTKGVNVVLKGPWIQEGLIVTDGRTIMEIGDKINYTATGTDYIGNWKVLGVSKYGEILIMSDSDVTTQRLGYKAATKEAEKRLEEAQNDWLNGAEAKLNNICEPYGKGYGATGARSITVEDINKVTGYIPEIVGYGKGEVEEYGNVVTYLYNGKIQPAYVGSNEKNGILTSEHRYGFCFYNGKEFVIVDDLTTGVIGTAFATIEGNYYRYSVEDLSITNKASLMLFGEYNQETGEYSNDYWLASKCIYNTLASSMFCFRLIKNGRVGANSLVWSYCTSESVSNGVRAVVTLAKDIELTGSSEIGWSY